jgi:hypothetical protein
MNVRAVVSDCLLLHWALPPEALPAAPDSLRYDLHLLEGCGNRVLATALFFFHEGVRVSALPILRFSYPQFSLALPVRDEDNVPALLFEKVLVPAWVLPAARLVGRQPVATARLSYDRPSDAVEQATWRWSVEKEGELVVEARQAAPGDRGPLGSWSRLIDSLRQRHRGYCRGSRGVRRFETRILEGEAWPLAAEVLDASLLERHFPQVPKETWTATRSGILFPELPLETELSLASQLALGKPMPQAAPSQRSTVAR